jgi:uncharacterized protein DUF445
MTIHILKSARSALRPPVLPPSVPLCFLMNSEHLEQLDADVLVSQIEERVGADLQFIRLNGALGGGLIGVGLSLLHHVLG